MFVRKHLFDTYDRIELSKPDPKNWWTQDLVYFDHLNESVRLDRWEQVLSKYPAIVPLRHPRVVYESWRRRRDQGVSHKDDDIYISEWSYLINTVDKYDPYYLPLDVSNRQEYLDKINKDLKLNLKTEWPVIHSRVSTDKLTPKDVKVTPKIKEFLMTINHFTERFYEI